jgi:hypothetical protein
VAHTLAGGGIVTLLPDEPLAILTDRQKTALETVANEAKRHGVSMSSPYSWDFAFAPEVRPGRGRDVRVWFCDGEKVATASIDVYGSYRGPEIASVEWECAGDIDAGLDCELCPDEDQPDAIWIRPIRTVAVRGDLL